MSLPKHVYFKKNLSYSLNVQMTLLVKTAGLKGLTQLIDIHSVSPNFSVNLLFTVEPLTWSNTLVITFFVFQ